MQEPASPKLKSTLRHGCAACRVGCDTTEVPDVKPGDEVIARTPRGVEYAVILTAPEEVPEGENPPGVEVLRNPGTALQVRVEKLLGGNKLTFFFLAEGRVDFRDLVRDLAREYRMRIELQQIGARDEAKILGDVSYCGRELCCSSWIREMKPVSMKMAKNQKSTLDPSKISGVCGRLLCCLRYEDEVYTELRRELPKRGKRVRIQSTGATGMVLHQEVLASQCVVLLDRGGTATIPGSDLELDTPPETAPN